MTLCNESYKNGVLTTLQIVGGSSIKLTSKAVTHIGPASQRGCLTLTRKEMK